MIEIAVDDAVFRDYLDELHQRLGNLTPVFQEIGGALETRVSGRFETKSDPNGVPWAPWASSTRRSYPWPGTKSKYGPGNGLLLDRYSDMLSSLSWEADATSVRIGYGATAGRRENGEYVPYPLFHEMGTSKMPRRGTLFGDAQSGALGLEDEELVLDILNRWLSDA